MSYRPEITPLDPGTNPPAVALAVPDDWDELCDRCGKPLTDVEYHDLKAEVPTLQVLDTPLKEGDTPRAIALEVLTTYECRDTA